MGSIVEKIAEICAEYPFRVGVTALNLQTNESISYQADEVFPTASMIKLAVLTTLMQQCEAGQTSLEEPLMLRRGDKIGGSGLLQFLTPGVVMPVRDWAFLMMNISDNVATNVLIDHVGLLNIQKWLTEFEFTGVEIHRKIDFGELAKDKRQLGTATPAGLNRLMTAVFRHQVVSPAACDEMLRMMDKVGAERIGRYLPFSYYGSEEPEEQKLHLAGKTGSLAGVRGQTAVVWRGKGDNLTGFSLTVMTEGDPAPELWSVDAAGVLVIGRIAHALYEHIFLTSS